MVDAHHLNGVIHVIEKLPQRDVLELFADAGGFATVFGQRTGQSGTEVGFGSEAEALPQDAHGGGDLRIDLSEIGSICRDLDYAAAVADRLKLFVGKAVRGLS